MMSHDKPGPVLSKHQQKDSRDQTIFSSYDNITKCFITPFTIFHEFTVKQLCVYKLIQARAQASLGEKNPPWWDDSSGVFLSIKQQHIRWQKTEKLDSSTNGEHELLQQWSNYCLRKQLSKTVWGRTVDSCTGRPLFRVTSSAKRVASLFLKDFFIGHLYLITIGLGVFNNFLSSNIRLF